MEKILVAADRVENSELIHEAIPTELAVAQLGPGAALDAAAEIEGLFVLRSERIGGKT